MLSKLRQRAGDEKGFTLIELLVVILIIGILAAIALPAFLNQKEKGQDAEAKSGVRTMQVAEETYYTDNQTYATTVANLTALEPAINDLAARPAARAHRGSTIVEALMGAVILITGVAATAGLLFNGLRSENKTKQRVAATNLARELIESARDVPYADLSTATLVAELSQQPGLS